MNRRVWAGVLLCSGVGAWLGPTASAATVTSAQVPTQTGVTGPTVLAPINRGGPSVQSAVGSVGIKGSLSDLPGAPTVKSGAAGMARPGVVESALDALPIMALPLSRMGFRSEAAPPGLPASAIPGAEAAQASYGAINPAAPAAFAVETLSDLGLARGRSARLDLPDAALKPGPGGGLPALRRQSLRLAAKTEAVKAQLSAAAEVQSFSAEEGAPGVGRRLMDILTDERSLEGSGAKNLAAGAGSAHAGSWAPSADAGARPFAAVLRSGAGRSVTSGAGWAYDVPAIQGGYWLAYRQASGPGPDAASSDPGVGGVALIALQVSRQSLILSVVDAPARGLALRWAEDSARSLVAQVPAGSGAGQTLETSDLRDAVAAPVFAEPTAAVPLGAQGQSAQSEVFSFLQSTGGEPADQARAGAPTEDSSRSGAPAPQPDHAPVSVPDPLLACALLPFLGLLILRSRLFS